MSDGLVIHAADAGDVSTLLALGAEHAAFERLSHRACQRADALASALTGDHPLLHAWIARTGDEPVGYASATLDFSTLDAATYLHMDCLYVRDGRRDRGIGRHLWKVVADFAHARQCATIQWQTPTWNEAAARFYRRLGARETCKLRYSLPLDAP